MTVRIPPDYLRSFAISSSIRLMISDGETRSTSASFTTARSVGLRRPLSMRLM